MTENGARKPRKGEASLLAGLVAGLTIRDAAKAAGIGERTATRCMEDLTFRQQVLEQRAEVVSQAAAQLADAAADAVRTLRELLKSESDTVRLGAARSVLELGARLREAAELEARVLALEAALPKQRRRA